MNYTYNPQGTCSRLIEISVENGVITDIRFTGGCNGNLKGLAAMACGLTPAEVADRLEGITCGSKTTSCPDQLARALRQIEA